jgi:hypothetical protein
MLGAEQLAPDRTGEAVLADIGAKEGSKDGKRAAGVDWNAEPRWI